MLSKFFEQMGDLNWLTGHEILTAWLVFKAQWEYEQRTGKRWGAKQC